ncbi:DNA-directed DNA polymerase gamma mip1, partial [Kappamyces sp. JEL0680]
FLDTLSLHSAVGGLSSQQRAKWLHYQSEKKKPLEDTFGGSLDELQKAALQFHKDEEQNEKHWEDMGSINGLDHVAELHLGITMDKSVRKEFDGTDVEALAGPERFQSIMDYCATDVDVTFQLFQAVFPKFRAKCPHPVSFAGTMHMSKGYLTTGDNWKTYIKASEDKYLEYRDQIEKKLEALVLDALAMMDSKAYLDDPWLCNLDWEVRPVRMTKEIISKKGVVKPSRPFATANPHLVGKPKWYRDLWDAKLKRIRLSTSKKVVPYLLKMEWKGFPLVYEAKHGWMFHGPAGSVGVVKDSEPVTPESAIPGHVYHRIPHPLGEGKNVGNPLSKPFIKAFEKDILTSSYPE